jgi:hypothetical protein
MSRRSSVSLLVVVLLSLTACDAVTGAKGAQGPQGAQGIQGIQGEPGIQGIQGEPGLQGIQGEPGLQGIQGIQGLQGIQGIPGQDVNPATVTSFNSRIGALEARFTGTRRWSAMGRQAIGRDIALPPFSEYAIDLPAATSVAIWSPQLPHGATITEWRILLAYCGDQTGNTLYCRLRRYTPPSTVVTLAQLNLTAVPAPCDQPYALTTFTPSAVVSDGDTFEVECAQTGARSTSVYSTSISYTP